VAALLASSASKQLFADVAFVINMNMFVTNKTDGYVEFEQHFLYPCF
jgi:hypothetical protein